MSYTNGIGISQQLPGATDPPATSSTAGASSTSRTESTTQPVASSNASSASAGLDETHLSSTANIVAQALSGSDVRTDKVADLQQSIASDTYSVPASDVADKVLSALLN